LQIDVSIGVLGRRVPGPTFFLSILVLAEVEAVEVDMEAVAKLLQTLAELTSTISLEM
jgi:uncharacterized membrane protein (Fun14 family)